jgi:LuxR family maltose regulon positive regulatory protein
LRIAQGRADQAMATVDALPDPHTPRAEVVRSRSAALGAVPQGLLRDVTEQAETPLDALVDAWIYRACGHLEHGQVLLAIPTVHHALQLAEPERIRRPFIDSTSQLRRLLRGNPALNTVAAWLRPTTAKVVTLRPPVTRDGNPEPAMVPDVGTTEPLSEREIEVLRLMAELLSTEEIGAAMFVSVNTVRTHVRSILRKLAVPRRSDAVRRARELQLV